MSGTREDEMQVPVPTAFEGSIEESFDPVQVGLNDIVEEEDCCC